MPLHLREKFRQNRIIRIAVGTTILTVALAVQYYLTKIPRHSIDIGGRSEFSPIIVRQGQQFVIDGPLFASPEGKLFSREPGPNEIVDVHFDDARLDELTVDDLAIPALTSSTTDKIDYVAADSSERSGVGEPCRTSLQVELKDAKPPRALHFYQMEAAGTGRRSLEMKTDGAELVVQMTTTTPPEAKVEPQGCNKLLRVGNRKPVRIPPFIPIRIIVPAGSSLRLNFRAFDVNAKSPWDGPDGLFAPFDLGPPMINPNDPAPVLH